MHNPRPLQAELERPRLVSKLQRAADHQLTLVTAPPGYGKTTAVAQFAQVAAYPVAWHSLEPHERDLTSLSRHSLSVLEPVCPGIADQTPIGTPAEMAAHIANYLAEALRQDVIYVLDDVHLLEGAPAAQRWLRTLLERLPRRCHLVLVGRSTPDLPLHEILAHQKLLLLGQDELRLTADEIRSLAALCGGHLDDVQLAELQRRLEGWPAGTLLHFQAGQAVELSPGSLTGEALFDGLAASMLAAQREDMRSFLLSSATLRCISPTLCQAALGIDGAARYLDELQRRNLFVFRSRHGLVYHSLLRTFLQTVLLRESPALFRQLHACAAMYFDQADVPDEAFDHYLSAGQVEQAVALAERTATTYFVQGRRQTLLDWADRLAELGTTSPGLLSSCVNIDIGQFQFERAQTRLDILEGLSQGHSDASKRVNVQLQRAGLELHQGKYTQAAERVCRLIEGSQLGDGARAQALYILGNARVCLGDARAAVACFEEALPLERPRRDAYTLSQLLQSLGTAYGRLGDLPQACAALQEVVALRRELGGASALAIALNNLGYFYHVDGEYDLALSTLEEGVRILAPFPENRTEAYLLSSLASLKRDLGQFEEACRCYERALEVLGAAEPVLRCLLHIGLSTALRWQGLIPEALGSAKQAVSVAEAHAVQPESSLALAALWAAQARNGEAGAALEALEALRTDLERRGARIELVRLFGISAGVALQTGAVSRALAFLRMAGGLGHQVGTVQALAAEVAANPELVSLVEQNTRQLAGLEGVVRAAQEARSRMAAPAAPAPQRRRLPYHVQVHSLGKIEVVCDGELVPTSAWRAANARELFLYLLFVGPSSREQICLTFWPDDSARRVRSNFHTILYYARLALGADVILAQDELYRLNPDLDIGCDALDFEGLVRQARLFPLRAAQLEDRRQRAVALYSGSFLPGIDREWTAAYREQLQDLYLDVLVGLGECQRSRRDYFAALQNLRRALALDPLREETHRAILRCYSERGDKHLVAAHMRELEALFHQELGADPSEETRQLARSLLT